MLRQRRNGQGMNDGEAALREEFSEEDINEAIRQSLAEHAAERKAQVDERRDVDRALAASVAGLLKSQLLLEEPKPEETSEPAQPATVQEEISKHGKGVYCIKLKTKHHYNTFYCLNAENKSLVPSPEEVERRRALLLAQRDKILSQKKKERQLQLQQQEQCDNEDGNVSKTKPRPKSGRAARAALAGEASPEVDERTIQYRRLLLQKIKEEVEGASPK